MAEQTAEEMLKLAQSHLERVQAAWDNPVDWSDLALYGFYCLEAALGAACRHLGIDPTTKHWAKVDVAKEIATKHGVPDVSNLLSELNTARKAAAYGDTPWPELDPEDVATEIEEYVEAVQRLIEGAK